MCGKSQSPTLAQQVADFVDEHTDVQLDRWQREFLDAFYSADPPSTTA